MHAGPMCTCEGEVIEVGFACTLAERASDVSRCSGGATFSCGDAACEAYAEACTVAADGTGTCHPPPQSCFFGVAGCSCLVGVGSSTRCVEAPGATVTCACSKGDAVCGDGGACDANGNCLGTGGGACTACGAAGTCNAALVCDTDAGACVAGDFCWEDECTHLTAISAGDHHACALLSSGAVQCFNVIPTVAATTPVPVWTTGVRAVTAGSNGQVCIVTDGGSVLCRPEYDFGNVAGAPAPVAGLSDATAVAVSNVHKCALSEDGQVLCWGVNTDGALGIGSDVPVTVDVPGPVLGLPMPAVALADGASCAVLGDGGLWCWGSNSVGQLGNGTTERSLVPIVVPGLETGVTQATMRSATCAVTVDADLYCWGYNGRGQVGNGVAGAQAYAVSPILVQQDVASVANSLTHTCAVTTAGAVLCWGENTDGELGDGTTTDSLVPTPVDGLDEGVTQLALGYGFSCALRDTGDVVCWGRIGGLTPTPIVQP